MTKELQRKIIERKIAFTSEEIINRFVDTLKYQYGKDQYSATDFDCYQCLATVIKEYMAQNWLETQEKAYYEQKKRVYYLSLEFLIGRSLTNAIMNIDPSRETIKALTQMGFDLSILSEIEWDAGLGNGGLGRLAACFLDSMSTLKIPAYGYGIRYEYGIFFQHIKNGRQVETPDNWLRYGSVWEFPCPEHIYPVYFGGWTEIINNPDGSLYVVWHHDDYVMAVPYDYLIPGYQNGFVNTLRLWAAKSSREFNLTLFNAGDYVQAVADKNNSETISKVLYPKDDTIAGKELRLKQEYFFVSATIQDILRRFLKIYNNWELLPDKVAIQLNDTHPAIAIAELMRILIDKHHLPWEIAWSLTTQTFAYTNHTILPEALEKWPNDIFAKILPRHLQIIFEINRRFLNEIKLTHSLSDEQVNKLSIIEQYPNNAIRMANLAIIGSHAINGVSELHTNILKTEVFPEFFLIEPNKFKSITNGITQRRWLKLCNPRLSEYITELIGDKWIIDLEELAKLKSYAYDDWVLTRWSDIKNSNKEDFSTFIQKKYNFIVNPHSIFDFQVKRIHEYKRQLLNALHILYLALKLKNEQHFTILPHTFFFSGKAAPGYYLAKNIIRLICAISDWIKSEKYLSDFLNVIFLPNYNVSLAEKIITAAEVSQQISTAGTEASGTGNMKFALNGALTVGTLDGANIEIREAVGSHNFFLFGMTADEVMKLKKEGYNIFEYVQKIPYLTDIFSILNSTILTPNETNEFQPILDALLKYGDTYCIIADFSSYVEVMEAVNEMYQNKQEWTKMSIYNVSGMGRFSSDYTIKQYAKQIWKVM